MRKPDFTTDAAKAALAAGHGVYAIDWSSIEERIKTCKGVVTNTNQVMDPFRMKALKEVYAANLGEEPVLIRARLLDYLLRNKEIFLDENPIVGTLTGVRCGVYTYPEWKVDWIKEEMDMAKICSLGEIVIDEDTKAIMNDIYKTWKGKTVRDTALKNYKELYGHDAGVYFRSAMLYDPQSVPEGTGSVNYERMLTQGCRGIIEAIDDSMKKLQNTAGDYRKLAFLQACKLVLNAMIAWANRYADLAEETAKSESDPKRKTELLEIAEVCRRVPEYPARNFREAVQCFWFTHLLTEMEQMGCATAPSRYGQYMYPFYKKDIEEGRITREEAGQLIRCQFVRHTELGTYSGIAHQKALSGHTGQTIVLGGVTADGKDASNELEMLLMDCQIKMRNIQPTLAIFYTPFMSDEYLMKAVDVVRTGIGQPQWMNNDVCVKRNLARFSGEKGGITLEDARNVSQNGCVNTGISSSGSMIGIEDSVNIAKFLELALYNGWDPTTKKQIGPKTGDSREFTNYEQLYDAFYQQMQAGMLVQRRHSNLSVAAHEKIIPSVFRSVLHDGCIESGLPEEAGGHKYPQCMCITSTGVDAGNGLHAIKHLVFDTKQITMAQLLEAMEANWVGHEDIKKMCYDAPKYGNDDPESDAFVQRVYADLAQIYKDCGPDYFGHVAHPDAYSLSFHNLYGSMMNAFPTGRSKGEAFTDGSVSAMPGTDKNGPTALVRSMARAIDTTWFASNHCNMKFLPSALEGARGARMLIDLTKTYFDEGGSHIQYNCVSRETLEDAKANPQEYKELVVRVAGFSAYYTRLDPGVQDEIIRRTQYTS